MAARPTKPVGLTYVAVAGPGRRATSGGSPGRAIGAANKRASAAAALELLLEPAESARGTPRDPLRRRGRGRSGAGPDGPARSRPASGSTSWARPAPARPRPRSWRIAPAARRERLRPGRPVALHAAARGRRHPARRGATTPRHVDRAAGRAAGSAGRHEGADGDRPGSSGAGRGARRPASRSSRGSRSSPTRRSGRHARRRGRHARQEHDRGLARPRARRARAPIPAAFVGALLPPALTGGAPGHGPLGTRPAFVVEADEYAGNFDPYRPAVTVLTSRRVGPPRRVRRPRTPSSTAFEGWLRRGPRRPSATACSSPTSPTTAWPRSSSGCATRRSGSSPRRSSDQAPQRSAATPGPWPSGTRRRRAGRDAARPDHRRRPRRDDVELTGLDPLAGPHAVRLATAGRHNAANALGVAGARGARPGAGGDRGRPGRVRRRRPAPGAQGRGRRGRRATTTTATTRRRSARRSRPSASASPGGRSGPSTSR